MEGVSIRPQTFTKQLKCWDEVAWKWRKHQQKGWWGEIDQKVDRKLAKSIEFWKKVNKCEWKVKQMSRNSQQVKVDKSLEKVNKLGVKIKQKMKGSTNQGQQMPGKNYIKCYSKFANNLTKGERIQVGRNPKIYEN